MKERLHHLDGLRGIAAFIVVLHHHIITFNFAFYSGRPQHSRFEGDLLLSGLPLTPALPSGLAVCLFFVLSGYVLVSASLNSRLGLIAQAAKRYVRLAIPILLVSLITWSLGAAGLVRNLAMAEFVQSAWLQGQLTTLPTLTEALQEGTYGALALGTSEFNSSLWTMHIELAGSLAVILLVCASRSLPAGLVNPTRIAALLALGFSTAFHGSYVALFGIGAAIHLLEVRNRVASLLRFLLLVVAVFIVGFLLGNISLSKARPDVVSRLVMLAPLGYSVNWLRMSPEHFWNGVGAVILLITIDAVAGLRRVLSNKVCRYLGDISFSLYLIHVPILTSFGSCTYLLLAEAGAPEAVRIILTVLGSIGASLLASHVLTRSVEVQALRVSAQVGAWVQVPFDAVRGAWLRRRPA